MRIFLMAFGFIATCGQVRADLIVNGSFEQPITYFYTDMTAGSTQLTGWTIVSGSVDVQNDPSGLGPAYQGNNYLDLDGSSPGHIRQSFATTIGNVYQLTFAYSNNPSNIPNHTDPAFANVSLSGAGASDLLNQTITHGGATTSNMNWLIYTDSFTANSTTTTLDFSSLDPSNSYGGIALDAVSVAAIPEPSPLLLLLAVVISLAGSAAIRRRLICDATELAL